MTKQFKIAVLLPTRGRTDALSRSVISLVNRAVEPNNIQLLLGFDDDDVAGFEHFQANVQPYLDEKNIDYTVMQFERMGYLRLNEYVNALALQADADWLCFWNDDAIMETTGWDREIARHTGEFKLLAVHTHRDHPYSIFPIAPVQWLETLGYLSPHQISDAWLSQQAYMLDIWERIEVYVTHDRHDLTGNNKDETFDNRPMLEGNPKNPGDFHHPTWIVRRMNDADTLAKYMKQQGLDTAWWERVKIGEQFPWEKLKANDINNQMAHFKINFGQS